MAGDGKGTEDGSGKARVPVVYGLSSSDNPGNIIITCRLNGDNYLMWSKAIRMALNAKHKLPFIDGTIVKLEDEETRELWESCNSTLNSWIFNTMEEDLQSIIFGAIDVKAMWDELRERYSQRNLAMVYYLKSRLAVHKQNGQSVQKYYGKFTQLWRDLDNYAESPKCTCENSTCEIGRKLAAEKEKEKEKGLQFLMGLNPEFATMRSNLLGTEPLPSLNAIYSKVTLEEKLVVVARSWENKQETTAFVAKAAWTTENGAKTGWQMLAEAVTSVGLSCNFCGRMGHTRNNCWALHGLPAD